MTGSPDVLVTSGLTTLGLDSLGIVEVGACVCHLYDTKQILYFDIYTLIQSFHSTLPSEQLGGRLKKAFGVELEALKLTADSTIADIAKIIHKLQVRTAYFLRPSIAVAVHHLVNVS